MNTNRKVRHWPTHWMGGSNSVKIGKENVPWVEFEDGGELCRMSTGGEMTTEETVKRAKCVEQAWNATYGANLNPKGVQAAVEALKRCLPDFEIDESAHDGLAACEISIGDVKAIRQALAALEETK